MIARMTVISAILTIGLLWLTPTMECGKIACTTCPIACRLKKRMKCSSRAIVTERLSSDTKAARYKLVTALGGSNAESELLFLMTLQRQVLLLSVTQLLLKKYQRKKAATVFQC